MKDLLRILLLACVASVAERLGAELVEKGESARWRAEEAERLRDLDELCAERDDAIAALALEKAPRCDDCDLPVPQPNAAWSHVYETDRGREHFVLCAGCADLAEAAGEGAT